MNKAQGMQRQKGMAMVISLIMLVLMTLVVVHGARSSTLEVFMANNVQATAESLLAAEDSAFAGEVLVEEEYNGAPTWDFSENPEDGLYLDDEIEMNKLDWTDMKVEVEGADDDMREYVVEYIGPVTALKGTLAIGAGAASDKRYLYRVSGRGESTRGSARVVQTIYATAE